MLVNKVSDDAYQWNGHDVVISIDGVFFYRTLWAFSDLVAAISAALHETFALSKYANSVSQFCYIYKGFVRQLKAFPPSLCQFCACETSPGWEHLITWMDPRVGHLNGFLARVGGNLDNNFQKSQMPGGLPGGMLKLRFDWYITGADLGGGCRGCAPPPEMTCGFLIQLVFCKKKCGLLALK